MVLWLKYEPQELVNTSSLSNEEWLSYRRQRRCGDPRHFALADNAGSVL